MRETKVTKVGDVFRDTYGDKPQKLCQRKIRVLEILPNGIRAEIVSNYDGGPPTDRQKRRGTTLMFRTLWAGYERVEDRTL